MLFFLFGADTFRKDQKLKQMTERFIREVDPSKMNLVILAPEGIDEGALRGALLAAPFLARKRMVVLKNFLTQKRRKSLHETLKDVFPSLGDDRIVVISEDEEKPKTWASNMDHISFCFNCKLNGILKIFRTEMFLPYSNGYIFADLV